MQDPRRVVARQAEAHEAKPGPGTITTSTSLTGGLGRLVGRVIIEEFEHADPNDDGIYMNITYPAAATPRDVPKYGRDLVAKAVKKLNFA